MDVGTELSNNLAGYLIRYFTWEHPTEKFCLGCWCNAGAAIGGVAFVVLLALAWMYVRHVRKRRVGQASGTLNNHNDVSMP